MATTTTTTTTTTSILPPSLDTQIHPSTATSTTATTTDSDSDISDLLFELSRIITEREKTNDETPGPGIDPAVLQQLQAVSAHMQTMNECLSKAVWQMDNGLDSMHTRLDRLSTRLDSVEGGMRVLTSREEVRDAMVVEKAAEEHNHQARLRNRKVNYTDKLAPLHNRHNRPIADFTADTPYKLAHEATRRDYHHHYIRYY